MSTMTEPKLETKRPWLRDTYAATQADIRASAAEQFAGHQLTEVGPQEWLCRNPKDGNRAFHVLMREGMIVTWGDNGEGVFRVYGRGENLVGWLRGAVRSPHYLLEKLTTKQERFYPGDVLEWLQGNIDEDDGEAYRKAFQEASRAYEYGELHAYAWAEIAYESGFDSEVAGFGNHPDPAALWLVEALRWFVEHLPVVANATLATPAAGGQD